MKPAERLAHGVVLLAMGGLPLGCATVAPAPPEQAVSYVRTSPEGAPAGDAWIATEERRTYSVAETAAMISMALLASWAGNGTITNGTISPLLGREVVLEDRRASLSALVVGATGQPAAGVVVRARAGRRCVEARTDARGVAVFWMLPEGSWTLRPGDGDEVAVTLRPSVSESVRLEGASAGGVPCEAH